MNFITELSPRLTSTPQPSGFNKYDFPSKKIVQIDWHKLASVDLHELNSGKCNVEILQEHLNHIAFCQPEAEIHVENAAGQRNILKMFRLAQLIIQYLFISQDYMESQFNQSIKEHQLMMEKYNEMKTKLREQIEEAKKIKKSNKSLTDSVIYLNSLLSSMGAMEHYRCPICPKAFRSKDYLVSHLQRKHPQHVNSVNLDTCFVQSTNSKEANLHNAHFTSTPLIHQNQHQGLINTQLNDSQMMLKPNLFYSNKVPFKHSISLFDQPSTSITQSHTGYFIENNNMDGLTAFPNSHRESESASINIGQGFQAAQSMAKSNDIDVYKVNEMQKSFNVMNDIVVKLTKDLEDQKKLMKEQFENRNKETIEQVDEKISMQKTYETMIQKLGVKIENLQSKQKENFAEEKEKLLDLIEEQKTEINDLKRNVNEKPAKRSSHTEKANEKLKLELQQLKEDIKLIQESHVLNIQKAREEFQNNYQVKLKSEIDKNKKQIEKKKSYIRETKNSKPITKEIKKNMKPVEIKKEERNKQKSKPKKIKMKEFKQTSESETDDTSRWFPVEVKCEIETRNKIQKERDEDNYNQQYISESMSNTDESYNSNRSKLIKENPTREQDILPKNNRMYSSVDTPESEEEENDDENSEDEEDSEDPTKISSTNDEVNLKQLTERNPNLWYQMKDVMKEELARRLNQFDISEDDAGISNRDLRSHLLHLVRMRKPLIDKYKDFSRLRKTLEKEVDEKLQDKTLNKISKTNVKESTTLMDKNKTKSKSLSKSFKRLASKMKFKSKPFQKSLEVRPTTSKDKLLTTKEFDFAKEKEGDNEVEEEEEEDDDEMDDRIEEESSINSSVNEVSSKTQVDIHNEAKRSVRRNLFPGSPLSTSPNYPRNPNLFINKTYDNVSDEEWDTESSASSKSLHEYENVKDERVQPSNNRDFQSGISNEYQEIKLKKPSGPKVTKLSETIENQLRNRSFKKLPGSVDITGNKRSNNNGNISDDIEEIEAISISE